MREGRERSVLLGRLGDEGGFGGDEGLAGRGVFEEEVEVGEEEASRSEEDGL